MDYLTELLVFIPATSIKETSLIHDKQLHGLGSKTFTKGAAIS